MPAASPVWEARHGYRGPRWMTLRPTVEAWHLTTTRAILPTLLAARCGRVICSRSGRSEVARRHHKACPCAAIVQPSSLAT